MPPRTTIECPECGNRGSPDIKPPYALPNTKTPIKLTNDDKQETTSCKDSYGNRELSLKKKGTEKYKCEKCGAIFPVEYKLWS